MPCGSPPNAPSVQALVTLAFDALAHDLLRHWHDQGHSDLTLSHFLNVLRYVSVDGIRPARIAEQAGVSQQATSLQIADLVRLGYLERTPDPSDRRAQVVRWSPKGEQAARHTEEWFKQCEALWRSKLGDAAIDGTISTLTLIAQNGRKR